MKVPTHLLLWCYSLREEQQYRCPADIRENIKCPEHTIFKNKINFHNVTFSKKSNILINELREK